jgi:hypothetical protein
MYFFCIDDCAKGDFAVAVRKFVKYYFTSFQALSVCTYKLKNRLIGTKMGQGNRQDNAIIAVAEAARIVGNKKLHIFIIRFGFQESQCKG